MSFSNAVATTELCAAAYSQRADAHRITRSQIDSETAALITPLTQMGDAALSPFAINVNASLRGFEFGDGTMKLSLAGLVGLFSAALVAGAGGAQANGITLPDAIYSATLQVDHNDRFQDPVPPYAERDYPYSASQTIDTRGTYRLTDLGRSAATVSYKNEPSPKLDPAISLISVPAVNGFGAGVGANSHLTYYFEITGPDTGVSVQIAGNAGYQFIANGNGGYFSASAGLQLTDLDPHPWVIGPRTIAQVSAFNAPQSLDYSWTENLATNHLYSLDLDASVGGSTSGNYGGQGVSGAAWIDPVISLLAPGFQLSFSPGVGNTATTPIPAALPLFVSALGGLGFVGWRRTKSKTAV